tara:strand:+ start:30010 stop:30141 length:132 start_codon:yes stop_codon:yes gene_type:complete
LRLIKKIKKLSATEVTVPTTLYYALLAYLVIDVITGGIAWLIL